MGARESRANLRHLPPLIAGRYQPLAKIAAGGMATVYLAHSVTGAGFSKLIALKCVHPHMADELEFVEMFLDEARIASAIDHPNVCTVFDAGEDQGTHYLAMEYLHGEPVSELIGRWAKDPSSRTARDPLLACRIIANAAMGLHAAHEMKGPKGPLELVHRDISPQNLFLTYGGSVKVVDFGIAKAAGRLHQTSTGVVKGKLAYMSPEQASNYALDRRTDVWALGVTLWEALTCRRLFKRQEQMATLSAVLAGEVPSPRLINPAIESELEEIVLKALAADKEERFATAKDFAKALNVFISSTGTHVGLDELAELMESLFPEEKAEKETWIAEAQANDHQVLERHFNATSNAERSDASRTGPLGQSEESAQSQVQKSRVRTERLDTGTGHTPIGAPTLASNTEPRLGPSDPIDPEASDSRGPTTRSEVLALPTNANRSRMVLLGILLSSVLIAGTVAWFGRPRPAAELTAGPTASTTTGTPASETPATGTPAAGTTPADTPGSGTEPGVGPDPVEITVERTAAVEVLAAEEPSAEVITPEDPELPEAPEAPEAQATASARRDSRRRREVRRRTQSAQAAGVAAQHSAAQAATGAPRPVRVVHPGGGWAELRVDGARQSNTPTSITLPPGAHRLEYRAYGEGSWQNHPARVPPGEGAHLIRIRLPPPG